MNKEKLIDEISEREGIAKKEVNNIINTAIRVIKDVLSKGEKVTLLDFGTFTPESSTKIPRKIITIAYLVRENIIKPGDIFTAKYKNRNYSTTVTEDGMLKVKEQKYQSPSRAGEAIIRSACDGWLFWKYKDLISGKLRPIAELRAKITKDLRKRWIPKK